MTDIIIGTLSVLFLTGLASLVVVGGYIMGVGLYCAVRDHIAQANKLLKEKKDD